MSRPKPLSGFPELTPEGRIVEQRVLDLLRETFERHGFGSVETRAVEPLERLAKQGEIDHEVYVIRRLHAREGSPPELGLHYDLTVPFARYVLEHAHHLHFPFRRYQIQKVWRGERPQEGRYREFTQADIDIVDSGTLAAHHDVELPLATLDALDRLHEKLDLPPVLMRVNNRRLLAGFYRGLDITDPLPVLRIVDKLGKIGPERITDLLVQDAGLTLAQTGPVVELASISSADESFVDAVRKLGQPNDELDEGLEQLAAVVSAAARYAPGQLVADLKIARGLDYYTGTVYETELVGYESWGSISSGGRYESLANDGRTTYPGVGLSIGVTRLLAPLLGRGLLRPTRSVPTAVLVAVETEDLRAEAMAVAAALRGRGIATEIAPRASDALGKQIRHASRRGIPYVWFGPAAGGEVKDIRTGEQVPADAERWSPRPEEMRPRVERATG